ncbi:MAG: AI-2E family transporter [Oscillatoriales cyanobacterium C42_A2020_001]|nr:AI-2E family transporter [Leptolyngbyaceae cyanobacterium C42_A2020_001]
MKLGHWIALVALIAAVYVLWQIKEILLMVFAAVVLANSLNLLARFLQKRMPVQRAIAVLASVLCLLAFAVAFVWIIVPPFAEQLQEIFVLVPQGINQLDNWLDSLNRAVSPDIRRYLPNFDSLLQQAMPYINRLLGSSFAVFSSSLGAALNILLILVLGLMMLINPRPYCKGFIRLFPSFYRRRVDKILLECGAALEQWIVGALISMTVIGILSTMGLALIGVKAALANGILAGLLNFIPNLGPTISVVPPMAIAFLDSPAKALLVLGLYIAIQQFESNFLTPFVMAQQVNLLPAVTLLAQVFFASIFGFWGLLLALPLVVVCQIWIRRVLVEDVMDRWNQPSQPSDLKTEPHPEPTVVTETVLRSNGEIQDSEETVTPE